MRHFRDGVELVGGDLEVEGELFDFTEEEVAIELFGHLCGMGRYLGFDVLLEGGLVHELLLASETGYGNFGALHVVHLGEFLQYIGAWNIN